jgi:tetratricopeptide (TPR) repeat protein
MKTIWILLLTSLPVTILAQDAQEINNLLKYRRYSTAVQKAKSFIEKDKNNSVAWYWLYQVYLNANDSVSLVNMPSSTTNDPWAKITNANILMAKRAFSQARTLYDDAIGNARKKDPEILTAVARSNIYGSNGDRSYAIALLKQAVKKDRKNPELYSMMGDAWFRLKNGSEAYTAFQEALKIDDKYAPALYELGKIFATQNNEELYHKYYTDAVQADPSFAPAWYELYYHSYSKDPAKALDYYNKYLSVADHKAGDDYQYIDLLYLTKQYAKAIESALQLSAKGNVENRLFKLLAYSYQATNRPEDAKKYMQQYFANGADSSYLVRDYQLMADIYSKQGKPDSAILWYQKAIPLISDSSRLAQYYKTLADYYKTQKDYANQARWNGLYFNTSKKATNIDLFNWGIALYMATDYETADSVFGIYTNKYPDDVFGPYWQARSNAAIDTTMTLGLAIPYYEKLITVAEKDTSEARNKKYLAEAYGYLATYMANEKKDYSAAIDYFEKLLEFDPDNSDAKKYIDILEKNTPDSADK